MQLPQDIHAWLEARRTMNSHRQLLVISGSQDWVKRNLETFLDHERHKSKLHLSSDVESADITNQNYKKALGQEYQYVVYDAFGGIRANALFALSGCVSRAGLMIITCPPMSSWPAHLDSQRRLRTSYGYNDDFRPSKFIERLTQLINNDAYISNWTEDGFIGQFSPCPSPSSNNINLLCKTSEQKAVVASLIANVQTPKSQTVITANRGRGKSSALGIAAAEIINSYDLAITITAVHKSMAVEIFHQANHVLMKRFPHRANDLQTKLVFVPFDRLLAEANKTDVLFVDEAAAIPNSVLQKLVAKFHHVVFTTTVQGYEGSGRGFDLRFKPYLTRHFPDCQHYYMEEPIRWQKGDVLESFWFNAMAMSPFSITQKPNSSETINRKKTVVRRISATSLGEDPLLLTDIFQLLIDAHYQTSPDDLLRLLDAIDQDVHVIFSEEHQVLAVAICNIEGGEKLSEVANGIAEGRRRVAGHLTAQKLAFEYAEPTYSTRQYYRIVRIAVRGEMRKQGLGSQLLDHIRSYAGAKNYDYLSTSFGLTDELLTFWQKSDFQMVKVGIQKDASSGEFSVLMLSALSPEQYLEEELITMSALCADQVQYFKDTIFNQMSNTIAAHFLRNFEEATQSQSNQSLIMRLTRQFVNGQRPLYSAQWALNKVFESKLTNSVKNRFEFLYDLLINQKNNQELVGKYALTGKKQIESRARSSIDHFLKDNP